MNRREFIHTPVKPAKVVEIKRAKLREDDIPLFDDGEQHLRWKMDADGDLSAKCGDLRVSVYYDIIICYYRWSVCWAGDDNVVIREGGGLGRKLTAMKRVEKFVWEFSSKMRRAWEDEGDGGGKFTLVPYNINHGVKL